MARMTSSVPHGILQRMWTYLQRWQMVNSLYHYRQKIDGVSWTGEHELICWVGVRELDTAVESNTPLTRLRRLLVCWFFGVKDFDSFTTKARKLIDDCCGEELHWITRRKGWNSPFPSLNLSVRGEEIYPYSHLIGNVFGNSYVKLAFGLITAWLIGNHLITINWG